MTMTLNVHRSRRPLRLASVAAAALVLAPVWAPTWAPAWAMAGNAGAQAGQDQPRVAQARQAAAGGRGDTVTLTEKEADEWRMRPVRTEGGDRVGHVAAITLDKDGRITELRVEPERLPGGARSFPVEPKNFTFKAGEVTLAMTGDQIRKKAHAGRPKESQRGAMRSETAALEAAQRYRQQGDWQSSGPGSSLKLTGAEADAWRLRPVVTRNGELIGHVAAVRLTRDGGIELISIEPEEIAPGTGPIAVDPGAFEAEAGKIVLAMDSEEIRAHGARR